MKHTKNQVINYMIKGGDNPVNAKRLVNRHFAYVKRVYAGQKLSLREVSNIMRTLGMYSR